MCVVPSFYLTNNCLPCPDWLVLTDLPFLVPLQLCPFIASYLKYLLPSVFSVFYLI